MWEYWCALNGEDEHIIRAGWTMKYFRKYQLANRVCGVIKQLFLISMCMHVHTRTHTNHGITIATIHLMRLWQPRYRHCRKLL